MLEADEWRISSQAVPRSKLGLVEPLEEIGVLDSGGWAPVKSLGCLELI